MEMQTDDVGIFGSTLSNEHLLVARHFGLSRRDLLEMCHDGIDAIFGGEGEKRRLRTLIRRIDLGSIEDPTVRDAFESSQGQRVPSRKQ